MGISRAVTGQTHSTSHKERKAQQYRSVLVAGCPYPCSALVSSRPRSAAPEQHAVPGRVYQETPRHPGKSQVHEIQQICIFRSRAEDEASGFGASSFPPAL